MTAVKKAAVLSPDRVSGQRGLHGILIQATRFAASKTPAYCNLVAEVGGEERPQSNMDSALQAASPRAPKGRKLQKP